MGVVGLTKFLKSVEIEIEPETLPRGAVLVVDGNGWLFYLLRSVNFLEYGGGYDQLHQIICDEVTYFHDVLGLNLLVYFDGENVRLKTETRVQRRIEREESWLRFYHFCSNKKEQSIDPRDIPRPVFAKHQLLNTLKELEVQTVVTDFEADPDMGRFCFDANQQGTPCFVYGDDRY
jgi:hypothetical protein